MPMAMPMPMPMPMPMAMVLSGYALRANPTYALPSIFFSPAWPGAPVPTSGVLLTLLMCFWRQAANLAALQSVPAFLPFIASAVPVGMARATVQAP